MLLLVLVMAAIAAPGSRSGKRTRGLEVAWVARIAYHIHHVLGGDVHTISATRVIIRTSQLRQSS